MLATVSITAPEVYSTDGHQIVGAIVVLSPFKAAGSAM
jgi:hypothetical protein